MNNSNQFCVLYSIRDNDGMSLFHWDSKKKCRKRTHRKIGFENSNEFQMKYGLQEGPFKFRVMRCASSRLFLVADFFTSNYKMAGDNGHVVYSLGIYYLLSSSLLYAVYSVSVSVAFAISYIHAVFATYITNTTTWHATHHFHEWKHKRHVLHTNTHTWTHTLFTCVYEFNCVHDRIRCDSAVVDFEALSDVD